MDKIETTLARVEERINHIGEQVQHLQAKLLNGITDRLTLCEKKVIQLEGQNHQFNKWADLGFKIVATVVGSLILVKLFGVHPL